MTWDMSSRRSYLLSERRRQETMLAEALARLSAQVDRAAAALDRPGGRAVRNRLVKEARWVLDTHRIARHYQRELDDLLGIDREPAQIIPFPDARIVELQVVDTMGRKKSARVDEARARLRFPCAGGGNDAA